MRKFDLIVIGTGSGLDVANAAASSDMSVCVVEKGPLGGTCLNRGCIPSKIIIHSADLAMAIRRAADFGLQVGEMKVDLDYVTSRASHIVDEDSRNIEHAFQHTDNPVLIKGEAAFIDKKALRVGRQEISADKILIATGTRPQVPDIPGLKESGYITSTEALRLRSLPRELIVLGGGYIAAELGHFFGALGSKVTIIQRHPVLLRREDGEIAAKFTEVFGRSHRVMINSAPVSVKRTDGRVTITAEDVVTKARTEVTGDVLLVATGLVPNTDMLNLGVTGVKTDPRGFIKVNELLETDAKGISALGDVVGRYFFKHNANHEAQYAYWNLILGRKVPVDYSVMPHAVFSYPQVAGVGLTEEECRSRGIHYAVGRNDYANSAMGLALQEQDGFVKLLVDHSSGKLLGGHIIGPEASILIHEVIIAMKSGNGSISNIVRPIYVHPALSEVVSRAASNVE
jgi:mycothione reductase